ncbi:hemerythrin HHE cation binding domain-containing protein [Dactylonectria estremocensis]|uniref:Hemerythrin HHE cation binding domain-containing protein n=1 Tax=Dactylonectria estremocensis TaxID=1079267 RepID=A0A9P9JKC5_9HYPO|nr:hemerythrin HHE cation binding domain-containing protein [Dactylonectria estremocensis]
MASLFADHPFPLMPTPALKETEPDMFCRVASEMALVHNMIIRGLNSIYLQAPLISPTDVPSFVQYSLVWYSLVHVHHSGEETDFFPYLEETTGQKGLMEINVSQHHEFHDGLEAFKTYFGACAAEKEKFDGNKVIEIIDGFGKALTTHLADEIPTLLQLREYGMSKMGGLEKRFGEEGEKNMKVLGLVAGLPCGFGNHDVQYESGRWAKWPPAPWIVHFLARNVTFWVHRDWWKFAACDRHGMMRPLYALSSKQE